MRIHCYVAVAAACVTSACVAQTFVGPLPYLSSADSPFDINAPTYVLETFEDGLFNVFGVTSNPNTAVVGPRNPLVDSVDADDGLIDGSGSAGHSFFDGSGALGVTLTFDAALLGGLPTHAGIVWTDGAGTATFEAFGPGGVSIGTIGPVPIGDGSFSGTTAEDRFFGVISAGGISSIKITNSAGGIEVDHFQFSFASECPTSPDIDTDGHVNATDLAILLGGWGPCPAKGCCAADLDDSGTVDASDLAILLGAWTG